jgi:hypothetical protein
VRVNVDNFARAETDRMFVFTVTAAAQEHGVRRVVLRDGSTRGLLMGDEHPLVQAFAGVTERRAERDARACAEAVQGDREVVDTNLGHGSLASDGWLR